MNVLEAIVLAIVEGLTEFLPVSSTGHLILTSQLLGIEQTPFVTSFQIVIQFAAILSVITLYYKTLLTNKQLWKALFLSLIPSMVVGLALYKLITTVFFTTPVITVVSLFVGGLVIIAVELSLKNTKPKTDDLVLTPKQALIIGLAQSIAVIPGVSRAGATIIGGMLVGLTRETAVVYSFLLAAPTMFAASVLDISQTYQGFSSQELLNLAVGFVISYFVAIVAMRFLIRFVRTHTMIPFGIYRIGIAILFALFFL